MDLMAVNPTPPEKPVTQDDEEKASVREPAPTPESVSALVQEAIDALREEARTARESSERIVGVTPAEGVRIKHDSRVIKRLRDMREAKRRRAV